MTPPLTITRHTGRPARTHFPLTNMVRAGTARAGLVSHMLMAETGTTAGHEQGQQSRDDQRPGDHDAARTGMGVMPPPYMVLRA